MGPKDQRYAQLGIQALWFSLERRSIVFVNTMAKVHLCILAKAIRKIGLLCCRTNDAI